jgi:hypothetical protein
MEPAMDNLKGCTILDGTPICSGPRPPITVDAKLSCDQRTQGGKFRPKRTGGKTILRGKGSPDDQVSLFYGKMLCLNYPR